MSRWNQFEQNLDKLIKAFDRLKRENSMLRKENVSLRQQRAELQQNQQAVKARIHDLIQQLKQQGGQ